jgi:hypothetical protein
LFLFLNLINNDPEIITENKNNKENLFLIKEKSSGNEIEVH